MDVEIDEVVTDLVVTEPVGSLSKQEMKQIIETVLQHVRAERDRAKQREKDTGVRGRAYQPEGSEGNGD
jgi:hypothetical protein